MKLPGFSAEKSIYRTSGNYRTGTGKGWVEAQRDNLLLPQQNVALDACGHCAEHPGELACMECYFLLNDLFYFGTTLTLRM